MLRSISFCLVMVSACFTGVSQIYTLDGNLEIGVTPIERLDIGGNIKIMGNSYQYGDAIIAGLLEVDQIKLPTPGNDPNVNTLLMLNSNGRIVQASNNYILDLVYGLGCKEEMGIPSPLWQIAPGQICVDGAECEFVPKVGIGTLSPDYELDVNGKTRIVKSTLFGNGPVSTTHQVEIIPSGDLDALVLHSDTDSNGLITFSDGLEDESSLKVTNANTNNDVFDVSGAGKVFCSSLLSNSQGLESEMILQVHNTSSTHDVFRVLGNGNIYSTGVFVKLQENFPFPDYVFMDDYDLMSLYDLETYIKENRRLPKMPSAEKVAEGGLDLGQNNRLLTEKVEELTLYLLQLKKEIDALSEQLQKKQ